MPFKGPNPPPEPTDYDPSNKFKDPVVYYQHKEAAVAEEFIKVAEARLIKKKLSECYRREGVNHVTACKELAERYLESIKGVGFYRANSGPYDSAEAWSKK